MKPFFNETNRQLGIEISNAFRFAAYLLVLGAITLGLCVFVHIGVGLFVGIVGWYYLKRVSYTTKVAEIANRRILDIDNSGRPTGRSNRQRVVVDPTQESD